VASLEFQQRGQNGGLGTRSPSGAPAADPSGGPRYLSLDETNMLEECW